MNYDDINFAFTFEEMISIFKKAVEMADNVEGLYLGDMSTEEFSDHIYLAASPTIVQKQKWHIIQLEQKIKKATES